MLDLLESNDKRFKSIREFYYSLDDYELEVALTDILLIYVTEIEKNFQIEKIYITQPVRDYEIDAVIQDKQNRIYTYQISKSKKQKGKLEKFLKDSTMDNYNDLLEGNELCRRINRSLVTLEKSSDIEGIDVISGKDLFEIIDDVWKYIGIDEENKKIYKENIQIRSAFWERINVHRRKKSFKLVNAYLDVMLSNHYSMIKGEFGLLKSIEVIENFNLNEVLTLSTSMTDKEKMKKMILFKSSIVYDGDFHKIYNDLERLADYLLELVNYDLNNYSIVPRCKYISVKGGKNNSEVIAYYPYKYKQKGVESSHAFGYKCSKEDLDNSAFSYNKIQESYDDKIIINTNGNYKKIKHGCSFKTPIYFVEPNLNSETDLKMLKKLFEASEMSIGITN